MTVITGEPEPIQFFLDRLGVRITHSEWERLAAEPSYTRVAEDVGPDWLVKTSWVGVVHNRLDDPLPFRTTVATSAGTPIDIIDSASETVAREVHAAEVARLNAIRE